jgi:H+/Cl- antiporter ClcA
LAGVSEVFEQNNPPTGNDKVKKTILYALSTGFGLLGFLLIKRLFPEESIFSLHFPKNISWKWQAIVFSPVSWLIGGLFGVLFLELEKLTDRLAAKIDNLVISALIAGLVNSSYCPFPNRHFSSPSSIYCYWGSERLF